jgi:hypothetical protein
MFELYELRPVVVDENDTATPFTTYVEALEHSEILREEGFAQVVFGLYGRTKDAQFMDHPGFEHIADFHDPERASETVRNLFGIDITLDWGQEKSLDKFVFASPLLQQENEIDYLNRVLVTVRDGEVEYLGDAGVQIELFDFDRYQADPERTPKVSALFADLAVVKQAPVESIAGLDVAHPDKAMPRSYPGEIVSAGANYVVQSLGRGQGIIHLHRDLDRVPAEGDHVVIRYANGRGQVQLRERLASKGHER